MLGGGLDVFKLPSTEREKRTKAERREIEALERRPPEYVARTPARERRRATIVGLCPARLLQWVSGAGPV